MNNNRLDFISNIRSDYLEKMREIRAAYIQLDVLLQDFVDDDNYDADCGAPRTIALARTNLEISLQYAIKSLCLIGEIR